MPETTYTYSVSTDFPNAKVDAGRLDEQIRKSSITTELDGVNVQLDVCDVVFVDALSAPEKITLDGNTSPPSAGSLIGDHDGEPLSSEVMWFAELENELKSNSTKYLEALRLTAENLSEGTYYIHWGLQLSASVYTADVKYRVVLDGTTTLIEELVSPGLAYTTRGWAGGTARPSLFKKLNLPEGTHYITVEYASTIETQTAILKGARLEITQVQ